MIFIIIDQLVFAFSKNFLKITMTKVIMGPMLESTTIMKKPKRKYTKKTHAVLVKLARPEASTEPADVDENLPEVHDTLEIQVPPPPPPPQHERPSTPEVVEVPQPKRVTVVKGPPCPVRDAAIDPTIRRWGFSKPTAPFPPKRKNDEEPAAPPEKRFYNGTRVPNPIMFRPSGLTIFPLCNSCVNRSRFRDALKYNDGSYFVGFVMCPKCRFRNDEMISLFSNNTL